MNRNTAGGVIEFLNRMLEAERAGVKVLSDLIPKIANARTRELARKFLRDEGMNCQILKAMIENAGHEASKETGDFVQKVEALPNVDEKIALLIKGQEWVAKEIRKNRNAAANVSEGMFLEAIKIQHEENVDALKELVGESASGGK
ncbi:MAG TPA: hypothetical protein DIC53_02990 [Synergistaceae bacterium]|jgi:nitronate monooxygenase|nr:hypothetical protein [Synergistaceae bacterium]